MLTLFNNTYGLLMSVEDPNYTAILRPCGHFCDVRITAARDSRKCCLDQDLQDYPSCDICRMGP